MNKMIAALMVLLTVMMVCSLVERTGCSLFGMTTCSSPSQPGGGDTNEVRLANWQTVTNDMDEIYMSWDGHGLAFYPETANVRISTSNGVFQAKYDCPVGEAAKAFLDAVEKTGEHLGYVILTRMEYDRLKGNE